MKKCGQILYSRTGHRWQYVACTLRAGYLRLQTHTQYVKYLLLSQGNDGFANASQYCVHTYMPLLFIYTAMRTSNITFGLLNRYWSEPQSQTEFWSRGSKSYECYCHSRHMTYHKCCGLYDLSSGMKKTDSFYSFWKRFLTVSPTLIENSEAHVFQTSLKSFPSCVHACSLNLDVLKKLWLSIQTYIWTKLNTNGLTGYKISKEHCKLLVEGLPTWQL